MTLKVDVLGTEYTVDVLSKSQDHFLERCDGYCDKTTKRIVVASKDDSNELGDYDVYLKSVLRHELIHAFLFESGLHESFKHADQFGHDETMIDWVATQFPKLLKAFETVGCL